MRKVYKPTKEHRKKLSLANIGKHNSPRTEYKKGHKLSKEHKEKIGRANSKRTKESIRKQSETMKEKFKKNKELFENITKSSLRRKAKFGYVNSPVARKKVSEAWKIKWAKGEVTEKQRATLFKKGYDKRRVKTQFKDGHSTTDKTILALKRSRAKQILPLNDTKIEVKIQMFLKELGYEFFTHQYMGKIEHSYQCDILIPTLNLVVECDGDYWHKYPIGRDIDKVRTKELIEKGFKVLRLWGNEIKTMDINDLKEKLLEANRW